MSAGAPRSLESVLKTVGAIVTVGSLLLALAQFTISQSIEAQKPYLEKKLAWCEEAANTAAMINVRPRGELPEKETRFWELYWGVMGLVENEEVTLAMFNFGSGLKETGSGEAKLEGLSIAIAHACRKELAADWSPIWSRE